MSSGGSNRKNYSIALLKRIDSFSLDKSYQEKSETEFNINGINHTVILRKVPNNYGGQRIYFACPRCKS
ncbi:MAG: hypothetical protein ACYCWE_00725 [Eubacteriales bacterium]